MVYQEDIETDDIYLLQEISAGEFKRERISRSSFGFPVNYRPSTLVSMPSNRFPAISGNGRHIYFSSDASDEGGLVFDNSNQRPGDNNNGRDIYYFDRKTSVLPTPILTVDLLFPNKSLSHSFAPNSQIPIVAQVNYSGNDLDRLELLVDGNSTSILTEFSENLGTNRFTGVHQTPQRGIHSYQVVAYNTSNLVIGASVPVEIFIDDSTNSLPPVLDLDPLIFDSATNGSSIPISIFGTDDDDAIVGVQYYVDGVAHGEEILKDSRSSQQLNNFPAALDFNTTGVKSIFAIGRDSAGNYVSSTVQSISVTEGTSNLSVSFVDGPSSVMLDNIDVQITVSGDGQIIDVNLPLPVGRNFVGVPEVQIIGSGSGAEITAVVDQNYSSLTYGMITDLNLNQSGTGYEQNGTKLIISPIIKSIGSGTPAEVMLTSNPPEIMIVSNADQSLRTGAGYITSPRMVIPPYRGFARLGRLPILASGSIDPEPFPIPIGGIFPPIQDVFLVGGFNQSPISLSFSVQNLKSWSHLF